jgi:hypothetical protein
VVASVFAGYLLGAVVTRRSRRTHRNLVTFTATAAGLTGGAVGASTSLALLTAYLAAYGTWPGNLTDQVLLIVSYPVLALIGFCLGSVAGLALGTLAGGLLRLFPSGR